MAGLARPWPSSPTPALSLPLPSAPSPAFLHPPPSFPPPRRQRLPLLAHAFSSSQQREEVFFDGGPHYGDLVSNLVFGLSLLWLPLTIASIFRALFLRYRFTNLRVTVISGLTGNDRKDFAYSAIKDVQLVPRFIGAWGDVVITLTDETKLDLKCVPRFREIAKYCRDRVKEAEARSASTTPVGPRGFAS